MPRRSLLSAVFSIVFATVVFGQLPSNELEGTWEMVSQKLVYPDSVVDRTGQVPYTIKILNSTHFAFGRQTQDEEVYAGGGSYSLDGNTYTEYITWHSAAGLAGQSITFEARVDGDTWYHTGHISGFKLEEVWHRVSGTTTTASK